MPNFGKKEGFFQTDYSALPLNENEFHEETIFVGEANIEELIRTSVEGCLCIGENNSQGDIKMKRVIPN